MMVLVTGARGFIGRHVALCLAAAGPEVVGVGHGAWSDAELELFGLLQWRNGEVSHANLDALATSHGLPDVVVHLAGGSAVGSSFAQPAEDFRRTVTAVGELAEWLRLRAPATRLVMASSAAVYGAGHAGPAVQSRSILRCVQCLCWCWRWWHCCRAHCPLQPAVLYMCAQVL